MAGPGQPVSLIFKTVADPAHGRASHPETGSARRGDERPPRSRAALPHLTSAHFSLVSAPRSFSNLLCYSNAQHQRRRAFVFGSPERSPNNKSIRKLGKSVLTEFLPARASRAGISCHFSLVKLQAMICKTAGASDSAQGVEARCET